MGRQGRQASARLLARDGQARPSSERKAARPKCCAGHAGRTRCRQRRAGSAAQATRIAHAASPSQRCLPEMLRRPRRSSRCRPSRLGSTAQATQIAHLAFHSQGCLPKALRRPRLSNRCESDPARGAAQATRIAHVPLQAQSCLPEVPRRPRGSDYAPLRPLTSHYDRLQSYK